MAKREFLMLAQVYNPERHSVGGWLASEKLDGFRAFWDGGISRGMLASEVPYANVAKDGRYVDSIMATGLWSRYGKVIHAPDAWLDRLPHHPLDGELYIGPGRFEEARSIGSKLPANRCDLDWEKLAYHVFDIPPYWEVFKDGKINNTNDKRVLSDCVEWAICRYDFSDWDLPSTGSFLSNYKWLEKNLPVGPTLKLVEQTYLPRVGIDDWLQGQLEDVQARKGEGLMLRRPSDVWKPERTYALLKVKPFMDCEVTVIGYTSGRETDKGSRHLGRMGALITLFKGKRLEISGFTDDEREFDSVEAQNWCIQNPGVDVPEWVSNPMFPRGTVVTIQYSDRLTVHGVPKEARYLRKF